MGWYERWAQWSEHYRFLVDLLLTLFVGLLVVVLAADVFSPTAARGVDVMLVSAAVLAPLAWSRTRPVASCVAVFVVCMVQVVALGIPTVLPADLAVLVSMYCITVYGPRWAYLMACGMAVVGPVAVGVALWMANDGSPLNSVPIIILIMAFLACAFAFGLVRRSRRSMLLAMRDRAERLEIERDQQAQIATAAERARIAREMHDIVAHSLSVIIAQADGGRYAAAADPAAAQRSLGTIAETGRAALADMRRLLGVLRDDQPSTTTPLGLVAPDAGPARPGRPAAGTGAGRAVGVVTAGATGTPAAPGTGAPPSDGAAPLRPQPDAADIGQLVEQARDDGMKVSWARVGVDRRLPPGVGLTLFRVCQEALTNVRKHAGPRPAVTVLLRWGEEEVELRVDDDGRGLAAAGVADPAEPAPTAGYGLLGMRERAEMFGGTLAAGPRRGGGFGVRFVVPIPRASAPLPAAVPDVEPEDEVLPDTVPDTAPDVTSDAGQKVGRPAPQAGPAGTASPAEHAEHAEHADQNDSQGAR
jgi:signal transduction histidine kinase